MQKKLTILLLLLSVLGSTDGYAQSSDFMPVLTNYSQAQYEGGMQNWACTQDAQGVIYFGNNKGLVSFDGYNWSCTPLPGNGVVRAILADGRRIYVGTYTDFGFFERNEFGQLIYTSLWPSSYKAHNDEIWNIIKRSDGHIVFQSFCSWFDYDGNKVIPHYTPSVLPLVFFPVEKDIYAQLINGDVALLSQGKYYVWLRRKEVNNDDVVGIIPFSGGRRLLATVKSGLFVHRSERVEPWVTSCDEELKTNRINKMTLLGDSTLVVGTILGGIYAIDLYSKNLLWHYNMENGLKNNTVLALFVDRSNNIWAALDNGISLIHTGMPIEIMRTDLHRQPIGMVYGVAQFSPYMYVATNQAVWQYDSSQKVFRSVSNSSGQNWYVNVIDNQIFAGHNLSTLSVNGTQGSALPGSNEGSTAMKRHTFGGEEVLVESGYYRFRIYKKVSGKWMLSHSVEGFEQPILNFEIDNSGTIWATHISKGLYRIELSKDLARVVRSQYYGALANNGAEGRIYVMKIRGRIVFAYQDNLYTYDDLRRSIIPYKEVPMPEHKAYISTATVDNDAFWASTTSSFSLFTYDGKQYVRNVCIPFEMLGLEANVAGVAQWVAKDYTYFFLNNGLGRYPHRERSGQTLQTSLRVAEVTTVNADNQTEYLKCDSLAENSISNDNIRILLSYPNYNHQPLKFTAELKGRGKNIKVEQNHPVFTFNSMGYGSYDLMLSVLGSEGQLYDSTTYHFTHTTPFYLSVWAILLYLFVIYLLIKTYINWRTKKIVRRNKYIAEKELIEQNLKILEQKQVIAQENQILMENELTSKGKELASLALRIATHNSNAETLREELLVKKKKGELTAKDFEKLTVAVENIDDKEAWNVFQQNFDLIHKNFFRNLRQRYPDLTPTDLKFCALLRLNYNTKEIAKFTSLTVRGVEGARYRLRKKMGIANDQSLTDFLIGLE